MIIDYERPKTLQEAIRLLERKNPRTVPLAGGCFLSQHSSEQVAVVDLQLLGMDYLRRSGDKIQVGAATKAEALILSSLISNELKVAIKQELPSLNTRNLATVAGTLVVSSGNSALATALMALDAEITWAPDEQALSVGSWLPLRPSSPGLLIEDVSWSSNSRLGFYGVGRSPADKPFCCVGVGKWPSGRRRIVVGVEGMFSPALVLDGTREDDYEAAINNACSHYINNNYLLNTILITTKRLIDNLESQMI